MSLKCRLIGDKWPVASGTAAVVNIAAPLESSIDAIVAALAIEGGAEALKKEYALCRIVDKKPGPVIAWTEVPGDSMKAAPILFVKRRIAAPAAAGAGAKAPAAAPAAKAGLKSPVAAAGAKAPAAASPTKAAAAPAAAAAGKKLPPAGPSPVKKTVGAPADGVAPAAKPAAKVVAKVAPKVAAAPPRPAVTPPDSDGDDGGNTTSDAESRATGPTSMPQQQFNAGRGAASDANSDDTKPSMARRSQPDSDADTHNGSETPARTPPQARALPKTRSAGPGDFRQQMQQQQHQQQQQQFAAAPSVSGGAGLRLESGQTVSVDTLMASIATQRLVDERVLAIQRQLVEEERRRVEQYETQLRQALANEVDQVKASLNASLQEERARAMHVEAALEEQRAQLLRALAQRDVQLQQVYSALQLQQQPQAVAAIEAAASPARTLAEEMRRQNQGLRELLATQQTRHAADRAQQSNEVERMVQAQAQLTGAVTAFRAASVGSSTSPSGALLNQLAAPLTGGPSTASVPETPRLPVTFSPGPIGLTQLLTPLGLTRFIDVLGRQDIDVSVLRTMSDAELAEAGVDTIGARRKIQNALHPGGALGVPTFGGGATGGNSSGDVMGMRPGASNIHQRFLQQQQYDRMQRAATGQDEDEGASKGLNRSPSAAPLAATPALWGRNIGGATAPAFDDLSPPRAAPTADSTASARFAVGFGTTSGPSPSIGEPLPQSAASNAMALPDAALAALNQPPIAFELTPHQREHERVLAAFLRHIGAATWVPRAGEMIHQFQRDLGGLYTALASKLGVTLPDSGDVGSNAYQLKQVLGRHFQHLVPAAEIISYTNAGREAEFADALLLSVYKQEAHRLVWYAVRTSVTANGSPVGSGSMHTEAFAVLDARATDAETQARGVFYFSALSNMTQWKRPFVLTGAAVPQIDGDATAVVQTLLASDRRAAVALPPGVTSAMAKRQSGNPTPHQAEAAQKAAEVQFLAATVALFIKKAPENVRNIQEISRAFVRPVADGGNGRIDYRALYADSIRKYGAAE